MSTSTTLLSSRATSFASPSASYVEKSLAAILDPHSKKNPRGSICMSIAENRLCSEMLMERMKSFNGYSMNMLNYTATNGMPHVRGTIAKFLSTRVFGGAVVSPDHLLIGAGVTSLLSQLSLLLFEANDSVLIPAPYYPAFDADFKNIGSVQTIPVFPPDHVRKNDDDDDDDDLSAWLLDHLTEATLEEAYTRAKKAGHPPKALLLTNPGNPCGNIYSRKQLQVAISWTRYRGLHLICDEIYALSLYDNNEPFVSIVDVLKNDLTEHVHVLWGISKDLGASGLRMGVLYSHNTALLKSAQGMNNFYQVSNQVQETVADILQDDAFIDAYLVENQRRLKHSFDIVKSSLESLGVKLIQPAGASVFVFADFRCLLAENSFAAEWRLYELLASKGVVLTPGESCRCPVPGFFRVCFAYVSVHSLEEAMKRIKLLVQRKDGCSLS